jgi:hypothetical protein
MNTYNYDSETKKYINFEPLLPNPLEKGKWLIPANSTQIAPPSFNEDQEAFWNGSSWIIKDKPKQPDTQTDPEEEKELTWGIAKKRYGCTWDTFNTFRSVELSKSDWVALPDVSVSNKQQWLDYRQEVRDLPKKYNSPEEIIWPKRP